MCVYMCIYVTYIKYIYIYIYHIQLKSTLLFLNKYKYLDIICKLLQCHTLQKIL